MLLAPRIICRLTRAMFRSRSTPLLTARRKAKVHDRCIRGTTARRRCCRAWNRSRSASAVVRAKLRAKPSGRSTNLATASRVSREPRPSSTLLIVSMFVAASPENRLEIETPSSASSPRPVLARCSMTSGVRRLVGHEHPAELTVVPPEGRDAGERAVQDALLAGRRRAGQLHRPLLEAVAPGVHPAAQRRHRPRLQRPLRHRERHPVELDEHHPVDLGVRDLARASGRSSRRVAVKASSVPAVASQVRKVPNAAAIQVAATRVQNESHRRRGGAAGRCA